MKKAVLLVLAVAVGIFLASRLGWAHHSIAMFDTQHTTVVKGTVTEVNWINPHVSFGIEVKDDKGSIEKWTVVLASPSRVGRNGWNAESLKVGDQITLHWHPAKNGSKVAYLEKVVLGNGQELSNRTGNAN